MNLFETNKIKASLTGSQIAKLFDGITNQILYTLNLFTSRMDINVVRLLGWVSNNRRKKISPIPRELQLQYLYYFICTNDLDVRYEILCNLKLDRFYIRKLAMNFIQCSKNYKSLYLKYLIKDITNTELLQMSEIENACCCSRQYLYPVILNLEEYLSLYKEITDIIISKYYKFLWSLVKKRVNGTTRHFDEDDLYQNYLSATLKAFDRYDPEKGALTSYISLWIKNNQQSAEESPEYGISYDLPALQIQKQFNNRKEDADTSLFQTEDNFSVSLESLLELGELSEFTSGVDSYNPDKIKEETDGHTLLLCLAKFADPLGIARLSLGIQEFFDRDMLRSMVLNMRQNSLISKTVNNNQ